MFKLSCIGLFFLGLPIVYALSESMRMAISPYRSEIGDIWSKWLKAIFLTWAFWSMGMTMYPHDRMAAYTRMGGVEVTQISIVLLMLCLYLSRRKRARSI